MKFLRANEILQAKETITVTYAGQPVWIDSVNTLDKCAIVHPLGQHQEKFSVPVIQLDEATH